MRPDFLAVVSILLVTASVHAQSLAPGQGIPHAQVVLLGTGTPVADPDRSGPAVAIVVGDTSYIIDSGPGVVRRAAAAQRNGINALAPQNLKTVFFTHLHADHTLGYPDLIFSPWMLGREGGLDAFGPKGLQEITDHLSAAWKKDIDSFHEWNEDGYKVRVHEIKPGVIYKDSKVTVEAVAVKHASLEAYAYRFKTSDRIIVISGDTVPVQAVAEACNGCDVLVHEVYCAKGFQNVSADRKQYHSHAHTSTAELAHIATKAKPKLLVLYHQLFFGCSEPELLDEVQKNYSGKIASGHDLDVF